MQTHSLDTSFHYVLEPSASCLIVHLFGWMGYENAGQLSACWAEVREQVRPEVALDLADVTCLASAALGSILALRRWLVSQGSSFRVIAVSPDVREILTAARLVALLPAESAVYVPAT
jgi:anti-anti-sigma factor